MTTIADAPAGYEAWPDIRTVKGGIITTDGVAEAIAIREKLSTGRDLLVRVPEPGRGSRVYVHPDVVQATEHWYGHLAASLPPVGDAAQRWPIVRRDGYDEIALADDEYEIKMWVSRNDGCDFWTLDLNVGDLDQAGCTREHHTAAARLMLKAARCLLEMNGADAP